MSKIDPRNRAQLIDQAKAQAEIVDHLAGKTASSAQGATATDQFGGVKTEGPNLQEEAKKLESLLAMIRGMSLPVAYEQLLAQLPEKALKAIVALRPDVPIRPGESARDAFRTVSHELIELDAKLRERLLGKLGELQTLVSSNEEPWPAYRNLGYYSTRDSYQRSLQSEADKAADAATQQAYVAANKDRGFFSREVNVPKVEPEQITAEKVDAKLAPIEKALREVNDKLRAEGFPESMTLRLPFRQEGGLSQHDFSNAANPKSYQHSYAFTPIVWSAHGLDDAFIAAKKNLVALNTHLRQNERAGEAELQGLRDKMIQMDPQDIIREIHQRILDLSSFAAKEDISRGVLHTQTTTNASGTSSSTSSTRWGDGTKSDGNGLRVRRDPILTQDSHGSFSSTTNTRTAAEFLLPEARTYVYEMMPDPEKSPNAVKEPPGVKYLYPGEEGFVADSLLRIVRLYEALSFTNPGSAFEEQLRGWTTDSKVVFGTGEKNISLNVGDLRHDLLRNAKAFHPLADYERMTPVLNAELEHPLRRAV